MLNLFPTAKVAARFEKVGNDQGVRVFTVNPCHSSTAGQALQNNHRCSRQEAAAIVIGRRFYGRKEKNIKPKCTIKVVGLGHLRYTREQLEKIACAVNASKTHPKECRAFKAWSGYVKWLAVLGKSRMPKKRKEGGVLKRSPSSMVSKPNPVLKSPGPGSG